jgi:hypothetical protein
MENEPFSPLDGNASASAETYLPTLRAFVLARHPTLVFMGVTYSLSGLSGLPLIPCHTFIQRLIDIFSCGDDITRLNYLLHSLVSWFV